MKEKLNFKISAALKDIIGRDLITDDFVAVFELVKNSFDAYATKVEISFENIYTTNGKIVIKDNGKGMNYNDLVNKWLFVAYSAKKEGTEDANFDYRNRIYKNRPFAGAKGIGRFSCDRLGKTLYLETKKMEEFPKTELLFTEWENFEGDIKQEFIDISVIHETVEKGKYDLDHGVVLEIADLRSLWDRDKLLKLRTSLAKLIQPEEQASENDFKIVINVPEELTHDNETDEYYNKVNGEIKNFIFEELEIKTTKIISNISENGEYITTTLTDGGTRIYKIKERNKFNLLNNIKYTIYFLNTSAKSTFTRRMGLTSNSFGHIFLYKNGFRVYPYGEPGEDPLKIDARKSQGQSRYFGTRDIIGRIEIFSDSNELKETSSRGDGLIQTQTYFQLEDCFWEVLKRLEKYVRDVQTWGISVEDDETGDVKNRITDLVAKLSGSNDLIDLDYSDEVLDKINVTQSHSAYVIVENLRNLAVESQNDTLLQEANRIANKLEELKNINEEINREKNEIYTEKLKAEQRLDIQQKEIELLKEASNDDIVELLSIEHHINQATFRVDGYLRTLYEILKEHSSFTNDVIEIIDNITLENKKIASLVKFVRNANFDLLSSKTSQDLILYISQYIKNVYKNDRVRRINKQLVNDVTVLNDDNSQFIMEFVPLEVNIVLDNLLDNSFKATATEVDITLSASNDKLIINYLDNGIGVDPNIKDIIFDFGVTTTSGSGIGLYHIKKIVSSMGGQIYLRDSEYGANFIIEITKNK